MVVKSEKQLKFGNDSHSLSPTSAISYLYKHFTQMWWKSKLLNVCLRKFSCFCGILLIVADLLRNFAEFSRNFAEFCGTLQVT